MLFRYPTRYKQIQGFLRKIAPLALSGIFSLLLTTLAAEATTIYFHNASANIRRYQLLKMDIDTWLAPFGAYRFEPFSKPEMLESTLEQELQEERPFLLLVSSWVYKNICEKHQLTPILVSIRNNSKYEKRILVTLDSAGHIETAIIASATSAKHTQETLNNMLNTQTEELTLLSAPKDIDSLLCLGIESAQFALITESSLNLLKDKDPNLYAKIRILGSEESLGLIAAVPRNLSQEEIEEFTRILQNMPNTQMKRLGVDGWQPLTDEDRERLEGRK